MPRKQVRKPATPGQVIAFYETADEREIAIVADIAQATFERRFPRKTTGTGEANTRGKRVRKPRAAATEAGESLSEA